MIKEIIRTIKKRGFSGIMRSLLTRVYRKKAKCYSLVKRIVSNSYGLEIGGLSPVFQKNNILPIYPHINRLDNCNFSYNTVWEGDLSKGLTYTYDEKHEAGRQFILEATDLSEIKNESYDFLLSSHMIEHTANPIKALKEWVRVVKDGGHLILIIPHKDGTFDHNRPVTTIDHLMQDYENDINEDDITHMDEILELHDLSMDLEAGTYQNFYERSKKNHENRCLHHHVFNSLFVIELMDYLKCQIKAIETIVPMHILVVVQKVPDNKIPNNENFVMYVKSDDYKSSFPSDKND